MRFRWIRALPALIVAALLALGLLASSRGVRARGGGELSAYYYPHCDLLLQSGGGTDSVRFGPQGGVTQPFMAIGNVAACSLSIERPTSSYGTNGRMDVYLWDPNALAPDPTTVALRSRSFQSSEMMFDHVRFDINPPIVTRSLPHQADGRSGMLAMNYEAEVTGMSHAVAYEKDGPASSPIAFQYSAGPRTPLPGNHPVLSHAICGGDAALQNLYVAQSVMTCNSILPNPSYELIQTFRVPYPVSLRWVELAFAQSPPTNIGPGLLAIVDAQGATTPPSLLPGAMVDATFYGYFNPGGMWGSHYDFDRSVVLQPNHDYFLVVRTSFDYDLYARTYTGSETNEFFAGVGGLFFRNAPSGPWSPWGGRALCFRVIGEPLVPLDVPAPPPARGDLRLRIAPNPSRGTSFVNWSGASGPVRFDVLDERGRRVAEGRGEASAEGRWLWRGTHDDGRPLPAGVYFVRARDDAGHAATERVVLVH